MIDKCKCPGCGSPNDGHQCTGDEGDLSPENGDLSLCVYCGTPARYVIVGDVMKLRALSEEELAEVMADPDVKEALAMVRYIQSNAR